MVIRSTHLAMIWSDDITTANYISEWYFLY